MPSGSSLTFAGRSYSTQCTQVPAGASGSSQIKARLLAPFGMPLHLSGGETSSPSQVCFVGIDSPSLNAELVSSSFMVASSLVTLACKQATTLSTSVSSRQHINARVFFRCMPDLPFHRRPTNNGSSDKTQSAIQREKRTPFWTLLLLRIYSLCASRWI